MDLANAATRVRNIHCCGERRRRVTSIMQVACGYMRLNLSNEMCVCVVGGGVGRMLGVGVVWIGRQREIWM